MASLAPFESVLGPRLAKHLLRRATFNISQERIDEFKLYNVDDALKELLTPSQKYLEQPIHYPGTGTIGLTMLLYKLSLQTQLLGLMMNQILRMVLVQQSKTGQVNRGKTIF